MGATSWTDPTITAGVTAVRKVHIDELRTAVNRWRQFYGLSPVTFTDAIAASSSGVAKRILTSCGQQSTTYTLTVRFHGAYTLTVRFHGRILLLLRAQQLSERSILMNYEPI